jgi:hypothetical protein
MTDSLEFKLLTIKDLYGKNLISKKEYNRFKDLILRQFIEKEDNNFISMNPDIAIGQLLAMFRTKGFKLEYFENTIKKGYIVSWNNNNIFTIEDHNNCGVTKGLLTTSIKTRDPYYKTLIEKLGWTEKIGLSQKYKFNTLGHSLEEINRIMDIVKEVVD